MEAITQGHEHTAVLWILLGDAKPQDVAVEPLLGCLVDDPQQNVTDTAQVDHVRPPLVAGIHLSRVTWRG
jgi:hypothetical protein